MSRLSRLQPVQIVEYEREAFVDTIGNVRITLDWNISGAGQVNTFFDDVIPAVPALPLGIHILEVKYDELLPDYIVRILRTVSLRRTSFSKYYYTRKNQMINWE